MRQRWQAEAAKISHEKIAADKTPKVQQVTVDGLFVNSQKADIEPAPTKAPTTVLNRPPVHSAVKAAKAVGVGQLATPADSRAIVAIRICKVWELSWNHSPVCR
jgi:hypothetical protein